MDAFATWFNWPMKVDGKAYNTDIPLRSTLAEIWIFGRNRNEFYRAWQEGVHCGRIYEVTPGVSV
jgi:hypothetical protein